MRRTFIEKNCEWCGNSFHAFGEKKRFCGGKCRQATYQAKNGYKPMSSSLGISTADVGAIAELQVCADLLKYGFHVFRSVSPTGPCDLLAFLPGEPPFRIEVKTGYYTNGKLCHGPTRGSIFDVLAVCTPEQIHYRPSLPGLPSHGEPEKEADLENQAPSDLFG